MPDVSFVVEPPDGRATWFDGSLVVDRVIAKCTDGDYAMVEHHLPPGFETPPHVHRDEKEIRYVLDGTVEARTPEGTLLAGPGRTLVLKRGRAHALGVAGEAPARTLVLFNPAGVEELYHEAGEPAADRELPDRSTAGRAAFARTADEYGMEVLDAIPSAGTGGGDR
jgi:quercetin dioxygenase-like cupin family protein